MLHTHSFIFAFPESWNYLTYQHSFHNHWKLKLSNISTYIYTFLHYYLCCSTHILFCITVMHEDLLSHDCIVLIITVYSHNIYQKHINNMKLKNWFQPQLIVHSFIIHYQDRERECVKHTICIFLFTSLSYNIIHLFIIIGTEGEVHCVRMYLLMYCTIGVLCTYYD